MTLAAQHNITRHEKLTGTADEMKLNTGHSTASLHPPCSCRSNRDWEFYPTTFAAVDPAPDASLIGLCQSAAVPPSAECPNQQHTALKFLSAKCCETKTVTTKC